MSDHQAIDALADQYLRTCNSKDAQACADFYTEDAVYIACGSAPLRGRSKIEALHESIFASDFQIQSIETTDVEVSNDLAYALQTLKTSQGSSIAMLVFKRGDDGRWRVCAEAEVS